MTAFQVTPIYIFREEHHFRPFNREKNFKQRTYRYFITSVLDGGAGSKLRTKHQVTPHSSPTPKWNLWDILQGVLATLELREGKTNG